MKKSSLTTIGALLAATALLAACGGQVGDTGGDAEQTDNKNLVLVTGTQNEPFYISLRCGAEAAAEQAGYQITTQEPAKFDATLQTEKVNALVGNPPGALIIAPTDENAMKAPIEQVKNQGSKIVEVDTALADDSVAASSISSDNTEGGKLAAQTLAELVGEESGSVLLLDTIAGTSTTNERAAGFEEELQNYPNLKSVGVQFTDNEPAEAAGEVTAAISAHPDLIGIFATNLNTGEGAATGLRNAGKVGEVNLVGFDASPSEVDGLRKGEFQALIAQDPAAIGRQGVEQAVSAIEGKSVERKITADLHALTQENMTANEEYFYKQQC
ncbi:ABC transporter substrate-binding protein [Amycolatopsis cihanbeyliensis]|uniref:Monosaccharide ABC transporter substrate-binding protein (CUT2 family) n=1 Tax=Amycolatopsis cihanbeyliensis TaxID=1128664 RepID=A0A542CUN9_AMYCI|nr:ABC transporter substrate-binding protein [Amycolatopsis cihanbeyliensis]TQI94536.1 monosaccharide ABC transporter substrate-binding protein (CUT2 family) [Amycolatopsis cihanbeyliensis]